jgi:anthranilate synthase component II
MLLMIDNYDSFTFNLVQYFGELGAEVVTKRNDEITIDEIEAMRPDQIVVSPGPCSPAEAGISIDTIKHFGGKVPLLGVCLGHQAIGAAFGGRIIRAEKLMHGKTDVLHHDGKGVFNGLTNDYTITRYHSLVIDRNSVPDCLTVTATSSDGEIMAVRHKTLAIEGVQFHPESILTEQGHALLKNFLKVSV